MTVPFLRSKGTPSEGAGARTAGAPPTIVAGDWLLLYAWEYAGANAPPDLTASGWTKLTGNSFVTALAAYAKIATGSSAAMPSVNYGSATDEGCYCESWGGMPATIAGNFQVSERGANLTSGFQVGALTPAVNGCALIYFGARNKTAATNASTINNWTAGGGTFTQNASGNLAGTKVQWVVESLIQSTATAISLGAANTSTVAESSGQTAGGILLAIRSSVAAPTFLSNPATTSTTTSSASFNQTVDSDSTLYGVAVTVGDTAPSGARIIAGQNNAGTAAAGAANTAVTAGAAKSITVGSLSAGSYDFYFVASNTNGTSTVKSVLNQALSAALALSVTISGATTDGYTLSYTPTQTGTVYAVALVKGSAVPLPAAVRTGTPTGLINRVSKACSASSADTKSFTGLTLPMADVHVIVNNGTTDSAVSSFLGQQKLPAAGRQYVAMGPLSITSPFAAAGLNVGPGDILDAITTVSGYAVSVSSNGDIQIASGGDESRELVSFNFYIDAAGEMLYTSDSQVIINNAAPIATTNPAAAFAYYLAAGVAITPINVSDLFADADGDPVAVVETSGLLASYGLALSGAAGSSTLTGITPAINAIVPIDLEGRDSFGGVADISGVLVIGKVTVPDVSSLPSEGAAIDALAAAFLGEVANPVLSTTLAGSILRQSIPAGQLVDPGTIVTLDVSTGLSQPVSTPLEGLTEIAERVFVFGADYTLVGYTNSQGTLNLNSVLADLIQPTQTNGYAPIVLNGVWSVVNGDSTYVHSAGPSNDGFGNPSWFPTGPWSAPMTGVALITNGRIQHFLDLRDGSGNYVTFVAAAGKKYAVGILELAQAVS